jgi:hypothetical protein
VLDLEAALDAPTFAHPVKPIVMRIEVSVGGKDSAKGLAAEVRDALPKRSLLAVEPRLPVTIHEHVDEHAAYVLAERGLLNPPCRTRVAASIAVHLSAAESLAAMVGIRKLEHMIGLAHEEARTVVDRAVAMNLA